MSDLPEGYSLTTPTDSEDQSISIAKRTPLIATAVLGAVILFAVGFAPIDVLHNAAHDTRHAHAFPCH